MVLMILKLGYSVLISDVDVYWFGNPLPLLCSYGPAVLAAQSDEFKKIGMFPNAVPASLLMEKYPGKCVTRPEVFKKPQEFLARGEPITWTQVLYTTIYCSQKLKRKKQKKVSGKEPAEGKVMILDGRSLQIQKGKTWIILLAPLVTLSPRKGGPLSPPPRDPQLIMRSPYVLRDPRWGRCHESYSKDHIVQVMTEIITCLQGDMPPNFQKGAVFGW